MNLGGKSLKSSVNNKGDAKLLLKSLNWRNMLSSFGSSILCGLC